MTDTDIKALVERLRGGIYWGGALREAADALEVLAAETGRLENAEAELKRLLPFVPAYPYGHPYREAQRKAMKEAREVLEHD